MRTEHFIVVVLAGAIGVACFGPLVPPLPRNQLPNQGSGQQHRHETAADPGRQLHDGDQQGGNRPAAQGFSGAEAGMVRGRMSGAPGADHKPFYLGAYEVTVGQFRKFVADSGYKTDAEKDGKGGYGGTRQKANLSRSRSTRGATRVSRRRTSIRW